MPDREKVMTWLEICGKNNDCSGCCPYSENGFGECGQCRESLMADAYDLLKEQDAVEKNKECIEDQNAVECLNAIQTINKYIDEEEDECGCSYWKDRKGYEFKADIGYFFEGLDNFEAYIIKRLRQAVKWDD